MTQRKPAAKTAKPAQGKAEKPAPRKRIDWEAVERDYRCGNLTLRQLATKHGCTHPAITKMVKKNGWTQDLTKAVKAATNAKLIEHAVTEAVSTGIQAVTTTVLAAAEVNTRVVIEHRRRLQALNADAEAARAKLLTLADSVADVREASVLVGALESLGRLTKLLIDKEREAFNITEGDGDEGEKKRSVIPIEFVDAPYREVPGGG